MEHARCANARGPSRRALLQLALAAVAAVPLGGCNPFADTKPDAAPSPDPLVPLITDTVDLAERYETAISTFPELAERLEPIARAHREHAAELARAAGTPLPEATSVSPTSGVGATPGGPATGDEAATLTALRTAEQRAQEAAVEACLAATNGRAALLGSIAAARATHLEALK